MTTNEFVSLKSAISDWLDDTGENAVDDSLVMRWAMSAVEELSTPEQMVHRVAILPLKDYKAILPEDFRLVCQVAYRWDGEKKPITREQVSQWVCDASDGCELEINLKCPRCKETKCTCGSRVIEVDVDRIHEMAHPEYYYKHFTKVRHWGKDASSYDPRFKLMKPFGNKFRSQHIPGCLNLSCDTDKRYDISNRILDTNLESGEILLSYLGYRLDEEGYPLIPNNPKVFEAIFFSVEFKWFWRMYRKTADLKYRRVWGDAKAERDRLIGAARSAIDIPDYEEFNHWIKTVWLQRLPNGDYDKYSEKFK